MIRSEWLRCNVAVLVRSTKRIGLGMGFSIGAMGTISHASALTNSAGSSTPSPVITTARAGGAGSGVGNGGDVIKLPNGKLVLADPYIVRDPDQGQKYEDFNPVIRNQIELAGQFFVRLGAQVDESGPAEATLPPHATPRLIQDLTTSMISQRNLSRTAQAKFLVNNVMSSMIEYHFVDILPSYCAAAEDVINVPKGAIVYLEACTLGTSTYIQKDLFHQMDPTEQMRLVLHERIHSLDQVFPHPYIADITDGVALVLNLDQAQKAGQRIQLTGEQVNTLTLLVKRIGQLRDLDDKSDIDPEYFNNWRIVNNGGALVHNSVRVSPQSYLGVGSLLSESSTIADNALMMNSVCFSSTCTIGTGVSFIDSAIVAADDDSADFSAVLDDQSKITRSQIMIKRPNSGTDQDMDAIHLSPQASMTDSKLQGVYSVQLDNAAEIDNSQLAFNAVQSNQNTTAALINVHLSAQSTLSHFSGYFMVSNATQPKQSFAVSLMANQSLVFSQNLACPVGMIPLLNRDLALTSDLNALTTLCTAPF